MGNHFEKQRAEQRKKKMARDARGRHWCVATVALQNMALNPKRSQRNTPLSPPPAFPQSNYNGNNPGALAQR